MPKTTLIYYEQYDYGGVDTHLAYLANNWPEQDDEIIILSNKDNKGLEVLKTRLSNNDQVKIMTIDFGQSVKRSRVVKFFSFAVEFIKVIKKTAPDTLLSNNGGYPGGDLFNCGYPWENKQAVHAYLIIDSSRT